MQVMSLVIVGKHSDELNPVLSERQKNDETKRPERLPFEKFVYKNKYKK
ncbi:MAG TPA: hypothetical protein HA346_01610 [Thermoplasmata archaeon]|nr:hypothetical protein [Thermoplasmata archaeon]HIH97693.1 hypothetical protein [Thermoplasmata archaeon]